MTFLPQKVAARPLADVLDEAGLLIDVDESILQRLFTNGADLPPECFFPDQLRQVSIDGNKHPHPRTGTP